MVEVVFSPVTESISGLMVVIGEDATRRSVVVGGKKTVRETDFAVGMS